METIYQAANILEAHIVAGMLRAAGITANVGGHYLQGGVGELAPMNIATVAVATEDSVAARALVKQYEAGEAVNEEAP